MSCNNARQRVRRVVAVVASCVIPLGFASHAVAANGGYTIDLCKLPDGTAAGVDGFQPTISQPLLLLENTCASGGSLRAAVLTTQPQPGGAYAAWSWTAAPDTTLRSVRVWRSVSVVFTSNYAYGAEAIDSPALAFDPVDYKEVCSAYQSCATIGRADVWNDPANLWSADLGRSTSIHFVAFCNALQGQTCAQRTDGVPTAEIRVHRFEANVVDESPPVVTLASGGFTQTTKLRGPTDLRILASDRGAGLYRVLTQYLDDAGAWQSVQVQPTDDTSVTCRDAVLGNSDPYEFTMRQPCPLTLDRGVTIDPSAIPNGLRTVRVAVEDAGGNLTEATRIQVPVANGRGIINGTGATDTARLRVAWYRGHHKIRSYKRHLAFHRSGVIRGRLLNAQGAPITLANIQVFAQADRNGATRGLLATITTDAHGTFGYKVPARQESRRLWLQYRTYSEDDQPAAQRRLRTLVRPAITLHVTIHGVSVAYHGSLRSGPIPRGGKIIVLQGRDRGVHQWATFASKRVGNRTGVFRGSYQLHGRVPGRRLQFRVVVPRDGSYGYAQGYSRVVTRRE